MSVQDTTVIGNAAGILIKPTGGIAAEISLNGVKIDNNTGGGLRVDGTGGTGAINLAIADSSVSFNASNGINAVSGPANETVSEELLKELTTPVNAGESPIANEPETPNKIPAPPCVQQGPFTFNGHTSQFPHAVYGGKP